MRCIIYNCTLNTNIYVLVGEMGQIKVNLLNCTPPRAHVSICLQAQQQEVTLSVSSYRILFCLLSALHFLSSFSTAVCFNPRLSSGMLAHVRLSSRFIVNIYGSIINQHPRLHFRCLQSLSPEFEPLVLIVPRFV